MGASGMSGLVIRDKNGENISYFGTQFEGLEDMGSLHLCVRTGSGAEDVVKYALTSKPLNDKYKALRMQISDGASGKEAYIAQRYVDSRTVSVSTSCTSSRSSQYTSTKTLTTGSYTRVGTKTLTRSASQPLTYYGSLLKSTKEQERPGPTTSKTTLATAKNGSFIKNASSSTNFLTSVIGEATVVGGPYDYTSSFKDVYTVTRVASSKVSSYTQTYASNVASSSATQTATASRSSEYTSSTSVSSTESFTSHNVDL